MFGGRGQCDYEAIIAIDHGLTNAEIAEILPLAELRECHNIAG